MTAAGTMSGVEAVPPRSGRAATLALVAIAVAVGAVLVFAPGSYFRWFLPKEVVLLLAVALAAMVPATGRLDRLFWAVCLAGTGWLVVAAVVGGAMPLAQVLGRWPRYEGLIAIPVYIAAAWLAARLLGGRASLRSIEFWYRSVAIGALVLAAVSVLEALGLQLIATDLSRPGALLGNASDQGLVALAFALLLALPFARAAVEAGGAIKPVLLYGGAIAGSVLTVVISGSRGALVALAVGLLVGLVVAAVRLGAQRGRRGVVVVLRVAVVAALTVLAVVALLPGMRDRLFGLSPLANRTIQDRLLMWQEALEIAAASPIVGVGPSGYAESVARSLSDDWYRGIDPGQVLDSPHSIAFQALVAGGWPLVAIGVLGALLVAWRFVGALPRVLLVDRPDPRAELVFSAGIALVGLLAGLMTHFTVAATGILGGLLVGIIVARPVRVRPPRAVGVVLTAVLAVWAVALAVATAADYRVAAAIQARTAVEASAEFEAAVALRAWDADLLSIAAQSLTQRADFGDPAAPALAIEWAKRAMVALPESLAPRIAHGVATRISGDPASAASLLSTLRDEYPDNPDVALQLAIALLEDQRSEEARPLLERLAQIWPDDDLITLLVSALP